MNSTLGVLIFAGPPHVTCTEEQHEHATRIVKRMGKTNMYQAMNMLRERLERAQAANHVTLVARTSVAEQGGHGVYALRDFVVGELLPFPYPGVETDSENHDLLQAYLADLTQRTHHTCSNVLLAERLLKAKWNLQFFPTGTNKHVHCSGSVCQCGPNWDAVYDTFCAYSFATERGNVIYWNELCRDGTPRALPFNMHHTPLFFNEPPPYKCFLNCLTQRYQVSASNVCPETCAATGNIIFRVSRPIARGDEMLFHYGPEYVRSYDVNHEPQLLTRFHGNFVEQLVASYNPKRHAYRLDSYSQSLMEADLIGNKRAKIEK